MDGDDGGMMRGDNLLLGARKKAPPKARVSVCTCEGAADEDKWPWLGLPADRVSVGGRSGLG